MAPIREHVTNHVRALVPPGTVLLLPSAPEAALSRSAGGEAIGAFYAQALALTAAAGHAGLPQLSLPLASTASGYPLGLGAIGWAGGDDHLLQLPLIGGHAPSRIS